MFLYFEGIEGSDPLFRGNGRECSFISRELKGVILYFEGMEGSVPLFRGNGRECSFISGELTEFSFNSGN